MRKIERYLRISFLPGPSPLFKILMNKLYNNALFMRFQNPQEKIFALISFS